MVWLRARPEDHWRRVIAQGDTRPMGSNPRAMDELEEILAQRESLYARAHMTIDTSHHAVDEIIAMILEAVA